MFAKRERSRYRADAVRSRRGGSAPTQLRSAPVLDELRVFEKKFLSEAWNYGIRSHKLVADAIVRDFEAESDPLARDVLHARLFGEYAASLETFAAWAWALRHRFDYGCFLHAYLKYRPSDVGRLYEAVKDDDTDLCEFLLLPAADFLVDQVQLRVPEPNREVFHSSLRANYKHLKEAADFKSDRVVIDAYNKTKHGMPLFRFGDENRFEVMIRNPTDELRPWRFAAFDASDPATATLASSVSAVHTWIGDLASIANVLSEADLLYIPILERAMAESPARACPDAQ
jgi:hypothetical protein